MSKSLKTIQISWAVIATTAIIEAFCHFVPSISRVFPLSAILNSLRISNLLGLSGSLGVFSLIIALLGISIAFLAWKLDVEEL